MAITGTTNLDSLELSGNLTVAGTVTTTGGETNAGSLTVTTGLAVGSNVTITGALSVGSTVSSVSHLNVGASCVIAAGLSAGSNVLFSGTMIQSGAATFGSSMSVATFVEVGSYLNVAASCSISTDLTVTETLTASSGAVFSSTAPGLFAMGGAVDSSTYLFIGGSTHSGTVASPTVLNIRGVWGTASTGTIQAAIFQTGNSTSCDKRIGTSVFRRAPSGTASVTTDIGITVNSDVRGTSNYLYTDTSTPSQTGNYGLYFVATSSHYISGPVELGQRGGTNTITLNASTGTSVGSAGTATAIPTPALYLAVNVGTSSYKIALLNP